MSKIKEKKENLIEKWDKHWVDKESRSLPRWAREWVNLCWRMSSEYWQEVFEKLAPGKKMLECGSGTAKVSQYMAKRGYQCTMLDHSEIGLNYGRIAFEKAGIKGDFVIGDVRALPFKDESFDIMFSGGLLEHFEDVRPIIKEMVRVLKPGGVFAADILPRPRFFSGQGLVDNLCFFGKVFLKIIKFQCKGSIKENRRNFPFYESPKTPKDYRKIMEEERLENIVATGTSPFPSIPFERLRRPYVKMMRWMIPLWKRFNRSNSKFTEIWGTVYSIYGTKKL